MKIDITEQEIEQYLALKEKIEKVEQALIDEENEINSALFTKQEYSGVVPHQLKITVMTDVYQIQSETHVAPVLIERLSQIYVIDFLDKSYKSLVDSIYKNMTQVLETSCKNLKDNNDSSDNEVSV